MTISPEICDNPKRGARFDRRARAGSNALHSSSLNTSLFSYSLALAALGILFRDWGDDLEPVRRETTVADSQPPEGHARRCKSSREHRTMPPLTVIMGRRSRSTEFDLGRNHSRFSREFAIAQAAAMCIAKIV